ncbi:hypothetical protein L6452_39079 [Arctium lappa]|uniref:Uncharacterized protein n=1 Tax=Arctium lappa TaxID=4217 RepID=A0ACB8XRJ0_ARCLA|nr:hypothetical protein L6452_39079 [Arctium lappa]
MFPNAFKDVICKHNYSLCSLSLSLSLLDPSSSSSRLFTFQFQKFRLFTLSPSLDPSTPFVGFHPHYYWETQKQKTIEKFEIQCGMLLVS